MKYQKITLEEYDTKYSPAIKEELFNTCCFGKSTDSTYRRTKKIVEPSYIPILKNKIPFPTISTDQIYVYVNKLDIFSGQLTLIKLNFEMTWTGYVSCIYDGEMMLSPIIKEASIKGTNNNEEFEFEGGELVKGSWPMFLLVCKF